MNRYGAVLILVLGLSGFLSAQDLIDKSAPKNWNTDLEFDFSVSNTGKLGTYRLIRLDTGETLALGHVGREISSRTTLLHEIKAVGVRAFAFFFGTSGDGRSSGKALNNLRIAAEAFPVVTNLGQQAQSQFRSSARQRFKQFMIGMASEGCQY